MSSLGPPRIEVGSVPPDAPDEQRAWLALIEELVLEAVAGGDLPDSTDARPLAFELDAIMIGADANFVLLGEASFLDEGRAAVSRLLGQI